MSDARHIDDRPALPLPRVLQVIGNVERGKFLAFADETGKLVVAMEAVSAEQLASTLKGYVANKDFKASNIRLEQVWGENLAEFSKNIDGFLATLPSPDQMVTWNLDKFVYNALPTATRNYEIVFLRDSNNHSDIVPYVYISGTWYPMCSYMGSDAVSNSSIIRIGTKDTFYHISESSIEITIPNNLDATRVYNGEFCIENTTADITLTIPESIVWVGDEPDFSVLGKHFFAYKYFNGKLYLNEYFVEEAVAEETTTESEAE